jgi:glycosyltransferase involved in cell wall biosynthesis
MKFSCICPTYNRFPKRHYLLEESLYSFLQQTCEDSELIIINDCPQQKLIFDHPRVLIVNLPRRCRTLGEKYNLAVAISSGDFIVPWEDDDVMRPMRLVMAEEALAKSGGHYYKAFGQWFLNSKGLTRGANFVGHNSSVYSRKAFVKAGSYPATSHGADTTMDRKLKELGFITTGEMNPTDWQYIYRWGVSDLHLSAKSTPEDPEKSWIEAGNKPVEPGDYVLEPKWLYPYSQIAILAAHSGLATYPTPDIEFWG